MEWRSRAPAAGSGESDGSEHFRIHVVYTTPAETQAALQRAEELSAGLDGEIALILTPIVPFPLPLDHPPRPADLIQDEIFRLAESIDREVVGYVYFCRDPLKVIERALRPHSLLVIGIHRRWMFSRSERLARALRRRGHDVITLPA